MANINILKAKFEDLDDLFPVDRKEFPNSSILKVGATFNFAEYNPVTNYLNCAAFASECNYETRYLQAILTELTEERCIFKKFKIKSFEQQKPITIVVALSRPQILKKIFETAAVLPIREIVVLVSDLSDKSFLLSKILDSETIESNISYGLKQSGQSFYPKVRLILDSSETFNYLKLKLDTFRILADCEGRSAASLLTLKTTEKERFRSYGCHIYIGPERGWSNREKFEILNSCDITIKVFDSVLRVDTATVAISSQVSLLYQILFNDGREY